MSDEHQVHRDAIVAAAQEWMASRSDEVGGSVITAWVMVIEVVAPNGERALARVSGTGVGAQEVTKWLRRGMLAEAAEDWSREE